MGGRKLDKFLEEVFTPEFLKECKTEYIEARIKGLEFALEEARYAEEQSERRVEHFQKWMNPSITLYVDHVGPRQFECEIEDIGHSERCIGVSSKQLEKWLGSSKTRRV